MTTMDRIELEAEIANHVAQSILKYNEAGMDTSDVMAIYVMSIGAAMSVLYKEASSSKVKNIVGTWAKAGFEEANRGVFDE